MPDTLYVLSFAVIDTNLFIGTSKGVFRSTDNGTSWKILNNGLPSILSDIFDCPLTTSGKNLFVGIYDNIYLSTDNGTSWTSANSGLTGLSMLSLATSSTDLFAGTSAGVWRRPLSEMVSTVRQTSNDPSLEVRLEQNYPNPVSSTTAIDFSIPHSGHVSLRVYDLTGRQVATLVNKNMSAGGYSVSWDVVHIPSGVYRYLLEADGAVQTRSIVVVR